AVLVIDGEDHPAPKGTFARLAPPLVRTVRNDGEAPVRLLIVSAPTTGGKIPAPSDGPTAANPPAVIAVHAWQGHRRGATRARNRNRRRLRAGDGPDGDRVEAGTRRGESGADADTRAAATAATGRAAARGAARRAMGGDRGGGGPDGIGRRA